MSAAASKLCNLILYQLGWFSCVLGAAWGHPMGGAGLALLPLLIHLWLVEDRRREVRLVLAAALGGVVLDGGQQGLGLLQFRPDALGLALPLWVPLIWAQFATLFRFSLAWLSGRYLLGALLGALGGPLAYAAGVRLGAADFGASPSCSLVVLGVVWALVVPLMAWLSSRGGTSPGRYRPFRLSCRTFPVAALLVIGWLWSLPTGAQVEAHGVSFAEQRVLAGTTLRLTGTALLKWALLFDVYVGALYLPMGQTGTHWAADGPKLLELVYLRGFSATDFAHSSEALLRERLPAGQYRQIEGRLEKLGRLFQDVQPGDRYTLAYAPTTGTELRLNGVPLGRVGGIDFARAYFGIWLGENPISQPFRDRLLGNR